MKERIRREETFSIVPHWLLFDPSIDGNAIRLFAVLWSYADKDGRSIYPSVPTLADRTGTSPSTVRRNLRDLKRVGAITVESRRSEKGDPDTNLYTCHLTGPPTTGDRGTTTGDSTGTTTSDRGGTATGDSQPIPSRTDTQLTDTSPVVVTDDGRGCPICGGVVDGNHDSIFEAIAHACFGIDWANGSSAGLTSRERGMANRARSELGAVGATADEVLRRARHFWFWMGQRPTPDNLVTHWNRLAEPQQRATREQKRTVERELSRADIRRQITEQR